MENVEMPTSTVVVYIPTVLLVSLICLVLAGPERPELPVRPGTEISLDGKVDEPPLKIRDGIFSAKSVKRAGNVLLRCIGTC